MCDVTCLEGSTWRGEVAAVVSHHRTLHSIASDWGDAEGEMGGKNRKTKNPSKIRCMLHIRDQD